MTYKTGTREPYIERAGLFALLADSKRLEVIDILIRANEPLPVGDLAEETGMSHSAMSHLLGVLFRVGIVENVREGRVKRYRLAKGPLVRRVIKLVHAH